MNTLNVILIVAAILTGLATWLGIRSVTTEGSRSRWTMFLIALSFVAQMYCLGIRGEQRGSCPLSDPGEILMFLGWSLTLFYLIVGSTYRLSLLGVFTAPVVTTLLTLAAIPGMLQVNPVHVDVSDYWWEMHTALSVISYGAFAIGAIAATMFVVLDSFLKKQEMSSGLFKTMPPIFTLVSSMVRLTVVGTIFLTIGLVSGFMMASHGGVHLYIALAVWLGYIVLLATWFIRGYTPKRMAIYIVTLFIVSLTVFGAL